MPGFTWQNVEVLVPAFDERFRSMAAAQADQRSEYVDRRHHLLIQ